MVDRQRFADLLFRVFWTGLLYVLVASAVLQSFMAHEGFQAGTGDLSLEAMVEGTGRRPFVHRVGSHLTVRALSAAIPDSVITSTGPWLERDSPLTPYRRPGSGTTREALYFHVGYAYCFGCLVALLLALRHLTSVVFPTGPPLFADVAPVVGLLFLPQTFVLGGYLYDFAELALLTAALAALWQRRLGWFAAWFLLGVIHKETALLWLVPAAMVWWPELPRRTLVSYLGALGVVGGGLVLAIVRAHADNPGQSIELHLLQNLGFWVWWPTYIATMDGYAPGILVPRGGNLLHLFLVGFLVGRGWPLASRELRAALGSLAALHVPLFLAFGYYDEIRALGPLFPGLYLLGCHVVPAVWEARSRR